MKLVDLEPYHKITIQCHDNPDADAIASGYALYAFFQSQGKEVSLIYSGHYRIKKTNLVMMVEQLQIPIVFRPADETRLEGLLITVDCQYGSGNVTKLLADKVAIIDHHVAEVEEDEFCLIQSNLGSCSTLVWKLLLEAGYDVNANEKLGTALYYGLFMDTYQFSEIYNPIDMDMRDQIVFDKNLITLLRNSNLSLKELEIAGVAMLRCIFNDDHNYAIIKAAPCDPNILGLISDFLLQVDSVHVCVVYNEVDGGFKLSVRSCIKEVRASELAVYLTDKMGSGGGHYEKAGGFINGTLYEQYYPTLHSEGYIGQRLNEYFDTIKIIYADKYDIDISDMKKYTKRHIPMGFAKTEDIWPAGTPFTIRTLEGDLDVVSSPDTYIIIGIRGEVHLIKREAFEKRYQVLMEKYFFETVYTPVAKNKHDGTGKVLMDYAGTCMAIGENQIYAKKLEAPIKVFGMWDDRKYMLGRTDDYLAVNTEDLHDIYIVESEVFHRTYREAEPIRSLIQQGVGIFMDKKS